MSSYEDKQLLKSCSIYKELFVKWAWILARLLFNPLDRGAFANYVYKRRGVGGQKNRLFVNFYAVNYTFFWPPVSANVIHESSLLVKLEYFLLYPIWYFWVGFILQSRFHWFNIAILKEKLLPWASRFQFVGPKSLFSAKKTASSARWGLKYFECEFQGWVA